MKFTIKQARQYSGLTQKEAARKLGVALPTYRDYEWGKTDMRMTLAKKFSVMVNIPFNQIIFCSFYS
ncbi:XRE family transcriptional regulator [Lactobacillus sp. ESL0236]|uniref:helix-turn-helix transcriptional regulator n=1 Tax=unclassified Lactobacillus TaxID=2620435 RepID=UPI000EFDA06D|nr:MULTISPECIES: helix-turn-helix transcriptional regulator [unclassified Lactobacillus]MCO6527811.1 helix-turn-helix transcriptional regulator [Lactobacillus sp.]RMC38151.1 XRE family transcriptional regulator [Lactobacillus sp. ESL0237]RMC42452.1 XRE family transcriptional regulator [Lactobacillus sp. ESL0234]RMC42618.1 XRE family transcriptional regulator [Lactobacillus sp. ESL0236]